MTGLPIAPEVIDFFTYANLGLKRCEYPIVNLRFDFLARAISSSASSNSIAMGFSKKTWIIGSIILGAVTTLTLGFISSLPFVILAMTLLSTSQAIANISVDGVMCCVGKQFVLKRQN